MEKKVCVFVDGENFRHAIVDLFHNFNQNDYLPRANWGNFFDWLVDKVPGDCERIRTYWYVIEHIDFYPYKIPNVDREPEKLKRLFCKDDTLKRQIEKLSGDALTTKMAEASKELNAEKARMTRRVTGWTTIQNNIAANNSAIEFRRAGAIRYNLFDHSLGKEKAVDVKLAVDMIMLREIYDVAVIVSGDQDYVPAVRKLKDCGKRVINVAFETRSGKLLPGGAWRLITVTDDRIIVPHSEFSSHLNL